MVSWGSVSEDLKCKRLDERPLARLGDLTDLETSSADMPATEASGVGCHSLSLGSLTWSCIVTVVGVMLVRWFGVVGGLVGWGLASADLKCKRLDEPPVALLGDLLDLETNSADMPVPVNYCML